MIALFILCYIFFEEVMRGVQYFLTALYAGRDWKLIRIVPWQKTHSPVSPCGRRLLVYGKDNDEKIGDLWDSSSTLSANLKRVRTFWQSEDDPHTIKEA